MSHLDLYNHITTETPSIRPKAVLPAEPAAETPMKKLLNRLFTLSVGTPAAQGPPTPMELDSPVATKITPVLARLALSPETKTPTRKLFGMFSADTTIRESFKKEKELERIKREREEARCFCVTCKGGRWGGMYCAAVTVVEFMDFQYEKGKEGKGDGNRGKCGCVMCRGEWSEGEDE
ncbi:uncharacterized protein H6S33_008105 [Morchella sextelata]|uniref:uncharacterized protein n=1 Tax=Morchella sextelata TaxID=1174677 RepID=UPI001D054E92|nr:uncharacterized protein H6S33_008105 [Morchella sextelata]KAH0603101.1 hypothetical protein H6S33_008105 [Morchella sextelata]